MIICGNSYESVTGWIHSDTALKDIHCYLGYPVVFPEGIVFSQQYTQIFVWKTIEGINYYVQCSRPFDSEPRLVFNSQRKQIESHFSDFFSVVSYSQVLDILKKEEHFDSKKVRSKYSKLIKVKESNVCSTIIAFKKEFQTDDCKKAIYVPPVPDPVDVLRKLGGIATLYEILKELYGEHITNEQCLCIRRKLIESSYVSVKDSEYDPHFVLIESEKQHLRVAPGEKILVVKKELFSCLSRGHVIESMLTDIPVIKNGELDYTTVEIQYCKTDDRFFIYRTEFMENIYSTFKKENVLKTFIYENKNWGLVCSSDLEWADKSPMNIAGYNVNQQKNLDSEERQKILSDIIEFGILDPNTVKSYLSWYIETLGKQDKNYLAVEKWKSDLSYIKSKYTKNYIGIWKGKIRY